jgi:PAS domain S-box-containing protein
MTNKKLLLFLRFIMILATILIMVYSKKGLHVWEPGYLIALIYFLSNLALYLIPNQLFKKNRFSFFLFFFDIITISLAIYLTQGIETDFFIIYFLVIFVASVSQDIAGSIPIAVVSCIIYIWLTMRSHPGVSFFSAPILIKIPFLFIISLVSSLWSESTRKELKEKKLLEKYNEDLQKQVTQIAAKEIELRQYNEKIIDSVPSGVIAVKGDGEITTLNPEACRVFGLKKDLTIGSSVKGLEGLSALWGKMAEAIRTGSAVSRDEVTVRGPDSRDIPIGFSISPIPGHGANVPGCVAIFKDLSEIRSLEEKLKHAERLSYLGKMASWVAHEIRNPLTAIDGFAQLLPTTTDQKKIELFTGEIHKGSQRINHIIDDILAFARTKRLVEPQEINLRSLIESLTKDIRITVNVAGDPSPISGETESLRRLFMNLINNGIEAMGENGKMDISFSNDGIWTVTEIRDYGSGIPRKFLNNLFTPFFTTKERGTGLGLAIVQKIAEEHGGKIGVESVEGEGTSFRVYLPIVHAGVQEQGVI